MTPAEARPEKQTEREGRAEEHVIRAVIFGCLGPTMRLVVRPGINCLTSGKRIGEACGPLRAQSILINKIIDEQIHDPRPRHLDTHLSTSSQMRSQRRSDTGAPGPVT
jgi:hypothetical protein